MSLQANAERLAAGEPETGIFVRAQVPGGKWDSVDIAQLDAESLLEWLRSRDGDNSLAENVVGILLGHGHLHLSPAEGGT